MNYQHYPLIKLNSLDTIPFDLLLLADETKEAIEKYIYHSNIYILSEPEQLQPIAVFALYKINNLEIELKNIAIDTNWQGKGIGSYLIDKIKKIAIKGGFQSLIVGTADSGVQQIHFYEKNGFMKYGIRRNFFIDNYPEPIIENGVMLRDMVMLKTPLPTS